MVLVGISVCTYLFEVHKTADCPVTNYDVCVHMCNMEAFLTVENLLIGFSLFDAAYDRR